MVTTTATWHSIPCARLLASHVSRRSRFVPSPQGLQGSHKAVPNICSKVWLTRFHNQSQSWVLPTLEISLRKNRVENATRLGPIHQSHKVQVEGLLR